MKIEKLKGDDTKEFKYLMQAAFQYGYESIFGKSDSEILPEKDIDRDLKSLTRTPMPWWAKTQLLAEP